MDRHSPRDQVFIGIAKDVDLALDQDDNLSLIRRNNWGVSDERIVIGPLSIRLIDQLCDSAQRLKSFATKP